MITIVNKLTKDRRQVCAPVVEHDGSKIVLKPCVVRANKTEYVVDQDWEHDLVLAETNRVISGYLVVDDDDDVQLAVDVVADGESPYPFDGSGYRPVYHLFRIEARSGQAPVDMECMVFARTEEPV